MADILVVDDEVVLARSIVSYMERRGYSAAYAVDSRSAMAQVARARPRLVILDVRLGSDNGMELLGWLRDTVPEAQIVVMTGHGEIATAVEAMKRGARDFLTKPASLATFASIASALMLQDAGQGVAARGTDRILGRSSAAVDLRAAVRRLAPPAGSPGVPILVTGPRGSGKATVARAVYEAAAGPRGPLTSVDCSIDRDPALDQTGGTLLLRNVEGLSAEAQARLSRLLADEDAPWLIATTSVNLSRLEREGRFRSDLLYRIQVGWIEVPPLSERQSDILPCAEVLARQAAQRHGRDRPRLTAEARVRLMQHDWPGNLTELETCMERAVLSAGNGPIGEQHVQMLPADAAEVPNLVRLEEHALTRALAATRGNVTRAAALLGISRDTLRYRIGKYEISRLQG